VGARFSAPVQTGLAAHPASCTVGTGSFPGVKSGQDVTLTPYHLLVPWSRKNRAIPLLPLWIVRPVQKLSACARAHFNFYLFVNTFKVSGSTEYVSTVDRSAIGTEGFVETFHIRLNWQVTNALPKGEKKAVQRLP